MIDRFRALEAGIEIHGIADVADIFFTVDVVKARVIFQQQQPHLLSKGNQVFHERQPHIAGAAGDHTHFFFHKRNLLFAVS